MRNFVFLLIAFSIPRAVVCVGQDDLPIVPKGFQVDVVAKEPMVSNPCVMAFDSKGRLCIAQGPQWRGAPKSPGDRIDILIDRNGDGIADSSKTFAKGFNSIQGMAWHGNDLWIANSPDLTVVRDTDGDDEADQYVRVYTGLGNLEHSLHGLNFAPDGKLYMSKGNSKGYNRLDQLAPKAFRQLWGIPSPEGAPDYTELEYFTKENYQRKEHTPADDWGQQGGILRCDPYRMGKLSGRNLEIISQGFRNPWDIAFDDGFDWLGTDNDQSTGDRIFMPFYGAHFGWGHPWSYHWTGENHLPTVPISAPPFEGSGTGVIYYHASQFPDEYQNVFFVGDWLRRELLVFRPTWDGALMVADSGSTQVFAHAEGGRTLPKSDGRAFDPTDIEVGPDGALYVLSWGHDYGGTIKDGKQTNVGRVYRIRYSANNLDDWTESPHRAQPKKQWTLEQLFVDLGCQIPAWRVNAQNELLRRKDEAEKFLLAKLRNPKTISKSQQTWSIWTLARLGKLNSEGLRSSNINECVQTIRALGLQKTLHGTQLPILRLRNLLQSQSQRLRFTTVQTIHQAKLDEMADALVGHLQKENDRLAYYTTWNSLRDLLPMESRRKKLSETSGKTRLGFLLGLLADDALTADQVQPLTSDPDPQVAAIADQWLVKTGASKPLVTISPEPGTYEEQVSVQLSTSVPGSRITYTLDGSIPSGTSSPYRGPITLQRGTTLKVGLIANNSLAGRVMSAKYNIVPSPEYAGLRFIKDIRAMSGKTYAINYKGLQTGKRVYVDRVYQFTKVPGALANAPFLQVATNDDRSSGDSFLSFSSDIDIDVLVGVDTRNNAPLNWMKIGKSDGFKDTEIIVESNDADFRLFKKFFPAGKIVLGGNTNAPTDSGRGAYIVVFDREILKPATAPATREQVIAAMKTALPSRGRELFLHPRGAGCVKCHTMEGAGRPLAPDLSDLGNRAKTPDAIIDSILKPSAVITEGFAQQLIATDDGRIFKGAVIEESGRQLKIVDEKGNLTSINVARIEKRKTTKLSPMPDGFDKSMSAQQIADIVAWLLTQKSVGNPNGFSFREQQDQIHIYYEKQKIATYLKRHDKLTRQAFVNLKTLSGIQISRNFPPKKPEDLDPGYKGENGIIHPIMHPGLWIGFGDVNGNDFWRLKAKVKFDGIEKPFYSKGKLGGFSTRSRLMAEDGKSEVCVEKINYQFIPVTTGFVIRIDAQYKSDQHDFYFGDQEESGLAIRVASPIRVQGGNGTILDDRGNRNGAKVRGSKAKWFDYFGTIDDRQVGLLVASSPHNPKTTWLHARDYGVVVTNPFPMQPRERREPFIKTHVKKGQPFKLSYAVLVHDVPATKPLDHKKAIEEINEILARPAK